MRIEKCQLIVRTQDQNSLCLHLVSCLDRPTSTRWCFITPLSFATCYLWGSYQNIRRTVTPKCYNATIAKVGSQPQAILWLSRILTVSCKKILELILAQSKWNQIERRRKTRSLFKIWLSFLKCFLKVWVTSILRGMISRFDRRPRLLHIRLNPTPPTPTNDFGLLPFSRRDWDGKDE